MREVVGLVTLRRHNNRSLLHREANRPLLRFPDCTLNRVVLAVKEVRVGEVAVVGHIHVARAGPHKSTNDRFGKEESTLVGPRFYSGDSNVRRNANDPDAVSGSGDGPSRMRAVAVPILRGETRNRRPGQTVGTVYNIDILSQIWMIEDDARVDVSN